MPVPKDIRDKNEIVNSGNLMKYQVGTFERTNPQTNLSESVQVFLHEVIWVLEHKQLIPDGKLVAHQDGNALNNEIDNLHLVDENSEHGDLHDVKLFHVSNFDPEFTKAHFPDVMGALK